MQLISNSELLHTIDNYLMDFFIQFIIKIISIFQSINKILNYIFETYGINLNPISYLKRSIVVNFILPSSSYFTIYHLILYNYKPGKDIFFIKFLTKTILVIMMSFIQCLFEEVSVFFNLKQQNYYNVIGVSIKLFDELIIKPYGKKELSRYINKSILNIIELYVTDIINCPTNITSVDQTIRDIQQIINNCTNHQFSRDLGEVYIKYFMRIFIRNIIVISVGYYGIIMQSLLKRFFIVSSIFLTTSLNFIVGNYSKNSNVDDSLQKNTNIIRSELSSHISTLILSQDSLCYSKLQTEYITAMNDIINKYSCAYIDYLDSYFIKSRLRNIPGQIFSLLYLYFFDLPFNRLLLVYQNKSTLETSENLSDQKFISLTIGTLLNKYRNPNTYSYLEKKILELTPDYYPISELSKIYSITLDHIYFDYSMTSDSNNKLKIPIFQNFSFNFRPGINILLGKSGQGKSTLIKLITGVVPVKHGQILINNQTNIQDFVKNKSLVNNHISIMSQRTHIFDGKSILFNITSRTNLLLDEENILNKVLYLCDLTQIIQNKGINFIIINQPSNLSEGQKKRICLAQTIYEFIFFNKSILVADEPTTGLEPASSQCIINKICKYFYNTNKIIIFGMHPGILDTVEMNNNNIHFCKL